MRSNAVAVLDIRSADITALIGERGVNHTFIFKGSSSVSYMGYDKGVFLDEEEVKGQIEYAVKKALSVCTDKISDLYVGVPCEFLTVVKKDCFTGFPSKRKIIRLDVDELFEKGLGGEDTNGYTPIRNSASSFTLSDKRRVKSPLGLSSTSLGGELSYLLCSDYFLDIVGSAAGRACSCQIRYIPAIYAEALYLVPETARKGGAALIDFGIYSTEMIVMNGDGVEGILSVADGEGFILGRLAERYQTDDETLLSKILAKANLFIGESEDGKDKRMPFYDNDMKIYYGDVNKEVFAVVDRICERIYDFIEEAQKEIPGGVKSLYVTGDGVIGIRGATEYITKILNMVAREAKPSLPFYNKTSMSVSAVSVLDMAQEDLRESNSFSNYIFRFLKKFGG